MLAHAMVHVAERHGTRAASSDYIDFLWWLAVYGAWQASASTTPLALVQFQRDYEQGGRDCGQADVRRGLRSSGVGPLHQPRVAG
jgi:hypothetical protein